MKYKVGDKVRIVSKRTAEMNQQGEMDHYLGTVMTIDRCIDDAFYPYAMKEDNGFWDWREDMIEGLAEPELTAEEAFKILGEIRKCGIDRERTCEECPISQYQDETSLCVDNYGIRVTDSESLLEICKQWKADHEKKPPQIETVDICRIEEILPDGTRRCVHEEDIKLDPDLPFGSEQLVAEDILQRYCMEHEGVYQAVHEVISRVKAVN